MGAVRCILIGFLLQTGIPFTIMGVIIIQYDIGAFPLLVLGLAANTGAIHLMTWNMRKNKEIQTIIKCGTPISGTIVDYDDDRMSMYKKGIPKALVVIQFEDNGQTHHIGFHTNSYSTKNWPIGTKTTVYKYNNNYAWNNKENLNK